MSTFVRAHVPRRVTRSLFFSFYEHLTNPCSGAVSMIHMFESHAYNVGPLSANRVHAISLSLSMALKEFRGSIFILF